MKKDGLFPIVVPPDYKYGYMAFNRDLQGFRLFKVAYRPVTNPTDRHCLTAWIPETGENVSFSTGSDVYAYIDRQGEDAQIFDTKSEALAFIQGKHTQTLARTFIASQA